MKKIKRKGEREKERLERLKARRRKKLFVYSLIVVLLIVSIYLFYWRSQLPGKYDNFAKCLTEKGFIMAGTDWCNFCKEQKGMFGKSFKFVDYRNCDVNRAWCDSNNVKGYPNWILPDGTARAGMQKLQTLSQLSGCKLK